MKKVKNQDRTLIALVVGVVLMLILTITLSYAYFTSKATSQGTNLTFGILEIDSTNDGLGSFTVSGDETHVKVVPGCTINMGGTIKLSENSNVDAFIRMKPRIDVTFADNVQLSNLQKIDEIENFEKAFNSSITNSGDWITSTNGDGFLYLVGKMTNSTDISEGDTRIMNSYDLSSISAELEAGKFGNVWQGATVSVNLLVEALQASHVDIDNVYDDKYGVANGEQVLVDDISAIPAWFTSFSGVNSNYYTSGFYFPGLADVTGTAIKMSALGEFWESSGVSSFIQLGMYPQTIKDSDVTIQGGVAGKYNNFEYYLGSDGEKYVKVDNPKGYDSDHPEAPLYRYSNGVNISSGGAQYFKLEPIVWKIANPDDVKLGKPALLICNLIIDAMAYDLDETNYSNNYMQSDIRAFLNSYSNTVNGTGERNYAQNGFLSNAFTVNELRIIQKTNVDNSASTTDSESNSYTCETTNDRVFLMNYNADFGSWAINKWPTDYAGAMGVRHHPAGSDNTGNPAFFWTRSPNSASATSAWQVNHLGGFSAEEVNNVSGGIIPVIYIQL